MYILHRTYYNMQNQYINRYKGNSLLVMVHKCTRYSVYHSLICNIENKFFSMPGSFVSIQILLVAYNHVFVSCQLYMLINVDALLLNLLLRTILRPYFTVSAFFLIFQLIQLVLCISFSKMTSYPYRKKGVWCALSY